jgi:hypothetical protein
MIAWNLQGAMNLQDDFVSMALTNRTDEISTDFIVR